MDAKIIHPSQMDIQQILKYLPHRYPFLLVDRVLELVPCQYIRAIKHVTFNEPQFTGHFPGFPVMPGVLILEAMAQTTGLLAFKSMESEGMPLKDDHLFYFAGVDNARFKRPVTPGDTIEFRSVLGKNKQGVYKASVEATVDGALVCSADLMAAYKKVIA